jgi:hypothetical protein
MLPGSTIKIANLHEGLDGKQPIELGYVSILDEVKRLLGHPAYSGKIYTQKDTVGKAKAGSNLMIWTAWVRFPPFPDADYLLC